MVEAVDSIPCHIRPKSPFVSSMRRTQPLRGPQHPTRPTQLSVLAFPLLCESQTSEDLPAVPGPPVESVRRRREMTIRRERQRNCLCQSLRQEPKGEKLSWKNLSLLHPALRYPRQRLSSRNRSPWRHSA